MDIKKLLKLFNPEVLEDYGGCLGIGDTETDYQLASGVLDVPKAKYSFKDKKIQYQQPEIAKSTCTLASASGTYSDITGFEFSIPQLQSMWELAKKDGAGDGGWYVAKAVKLVKEEGNKITGEQIDFYTLNVDSEEFYNVLDKGYSVNVAFRGNSDYQKDKNADGVLDGTSFGTTTFGHAVRIYKDADMYVIDNYPKTAKKNLYKIPKDNLDDLIRNGIFKRAGYIFAYKSSITEAESELWQRIPLWAKNSYKKAVAKGIILDISNPLKIVGDANAEKIYFKLGALTKVEGNLTEARMITAMDRLLLLEK